PSRFPTPRRAVRGSRACRAPGCLRTSAPASRDISRRRTTCSSGSGGSWRRRFEEGRIEFLAEDLAADRGQHLIVVVVADVDGEVADDALDRTGTVQRARAARADAVVDGLAGEMLAEVADAAPRRLGLGVAAALPQRGDVAQ